MVFFMDMDKKFLRLWYRGLNLKTIAFKLGVSINYAQDLMYNNIPNKRVKK